MGDSDKERKVPAVAAKTQQKAEPPDQSFERRQQIARHVAKLVNVRPSRVEVKYLYSKSVANLSMYRVHIRGLDRKLTASHFVTVTNPTTNAKGWQTIRELMGRSAVTLVAVPPFQAL